MASDIDEIMNRFLGPTGIPDRLRAVNQIFNPVEAVGQSMTASREMLAPGRTGWQRAEAAGNMLSGVAGFAAPMVAASRAGAPAANALVETFTGYSPTRNALADFATNEDGALRFGVDRIGPAGSSNGMARNPIFEKADELERILRDEYGLSVTVSRHPTQYGNSVYLEARKNLGNTYTSTGFRLSDHATGEARGVKDKYSTIIDSENVTIESLLSKIKEEIEFGSKEAESLSADIAKRKSFDADALDMWAKASEKEKNAFSNENRFLNLPVQDRKLAKARAWAKRNQNALATQYDSSTGQPMAQRPPRVD